MSLEYKESSCVSWSPTLVFVPCLLPCFSQFSVQVEQDTLSFGYGPLRCGNSVEVLLSDIDKKSVSAGLASCTDNLISFGGWGIRYGQVTVGDTKRSVVAYNSRNGPFVQFFTLKGKGYRFSCRDPEAIIKLIT
mmetsp:Transcript_7686/g.8822  ORF Transcript_7686/g.8822 Transcript_7686/m.8822 type:complete len:134 (+) Transcript_7686:199-600(+)